VLLALVFFTTSLRAQFSTAELSAGEDQMIGQPAPSWVHRGWVNSQPLEARQLRGKVVLLRFFSDQPVGAPAVVDLYQKYQAQGLAAVGFYTPQPMPTETDAEFVRDLAAAVGFDFPVAVDSRWETVNKYWLNRADAEPGGMTFLIDRKGIIRYIQPDGRYERNSRDRRSRAAFERLEKQIEVLLKEAPPATAPQNAPAGG
jgi:peroxiredoxin